MLFKQVMERGYVLLLLCLCVFALESRAAEGPIQGQITNHDGEGVYGLTVRLVGGNEALTDREGRYSLGVQGAELKRARLVVLWNNQVVARQKLVAGQVDYNFVVTSPATHHLSLVVTSTRGDSLAESNRSEEWVSRLPVSVTGEVLRQVPGVAAVRRGPVGLDPVVRGLRETQVGTYLDGTRLFPGGPGRMDSGLSHLDPSTVERIQVVKGPYALTWGAGNLSAIRVSSFDVSRLSSGDLGGALVSGYRSGSEATHVAPSVYGRQGDLGWWMHGVVREGNDYEDGSGQVVPAHMEGKEARLKLNYDKGEHQWDFAAGYQAQDDLDYPGRLLDADYFDVGQFSLSYNRRFSGDGVLQGFHTQVYYNDVDHGMDNENKPTAQANPNRTPPFPLDIYVDSGISVSGANFSFDLEREDWRYKLGGDFYRAHRNALRTIKRADTGMIMAQDQMWPDAVIRSGGLFAQGERMMGEGRFSGSLRFDLVEADAGDVTDFFATHVGTDTSQGEAELSGAALYHHHLNNMWLFSVGLGSVTRSADANERYSDRIPSSKAQTSAEFMGNPNLDPERSNQVDLSLEASRSGWSFNLGLYGRRIDDYITVEATDLPRRLPLSPPVVYRYVNGDAEFFGLEAGFKTQLSDSFEVALHGEYLQGRDTAVDEPAFGVTPLKGVFRLDYAPKQGAHRISMVVTSVSKQDRVAVTRAETPTDGYTLVDLLSYWRLSGSFSLSAGVTNLGDTFYADHLNAKNPFTGTRVHEMGRSFNLDLRYSF